MKKLFRVVFYLLGIFIALMIIVSFAPDSKNKNKTQTQSISHKIINGKESYTDIKTVELKESARKCNDTKDATSCSKVATAYLTGDGILKARTSIIKAYNYMQKGCNINRKSCFLYSAILGEFKDKHIQSLALSLYMDGCENIDNNKYKKNVKNIFGVTPKKCIKISEEYWKLKKSRGQSN